MPENWFTTVRDQNELEQGDILDAERILQIASGSIWADEDGSLAVDETEARLIVASHSCDLAYQQDPKALGGVRPPKIDRVIVCPVYSLKQAQELDKKLKIKDTLEQIRRGENRSFLLLGDPEIGPLAGDLILVDLRNLCQLPRLYLEEKALAAGERLRLKSPMREQFGQAVGNQFSRVAIDTVYELPEFASERGDAEECQVRFEGLSHEQKTSFVDQNKFWGSFHQSKMKAAEEKRRDKPE